MRALHVNRTVLISAVCMSLIAAALTPRSSAIAAGSGAENKSANVRVVAQKRGLLNGGQISAQGDLLAVAGTAGNGEERFQHFGPKSPFLYRITPDGLRELGGFRCPLARQSDISLWNGYLIAGTTATPADPSMTLDPSCDRYDVKALRVIDIRDPNEPRQVAFLETGCLFNHTLVPAGGELYIYGVCTPGTPMPGSDANRIKIFRFEERNHRLTVVSKPRMDGDPVCRDLTYYAPRKLVACMAEVGQGYANYGPSGLYEVSDPANPRRLAALEPPRIGPQGGVPDPASQTYPTQAQFTWDGNYLMVLDRGSENSGVPTCTGAAPVGEVFFYDIRDPREPRYVGKYALPDRLPVVNHFMQCAPFRANILPMKDPRRYVAVVAWQNQGVSIVDFSKPAKPKELAFFQPDDGIITTAYWYNGRIYASDFAAPADNGVWVLDVEGLGAKQVRYFAGPFNATTQVADFRR